MTFSLATTFEKKIIDDCIGINALAPDERFKIGETFGAMITEFGSGRNAYRLPDINRDCLKDYINYSHEKGIKFNYLINATCFNGKEASAGFVKKLCSHLDELVDAKVDIVTMANPILIKTAKQNFSRLKINTSINSRITSMKQIERFLSMGVDRLTIHYDLNRDFDLIKRVRGMTSGEIELLANNPCMYKCIFADYHMNMDAHASSKADENVNTLYPVFNCKDSRLRNPGEIIRSRWIRPADVRKYLDLGIDVIKIAGRNMDGKWLMAATEGYVLEKDTPNFYSSFIERGLWKYVSRKDPQLKGLDVSVDLPKDFLNWFEEGRCSNDCARCNHCENMAKKYVKFSSENLRKDYLEASDKIIRNETKKK